MRPPGRGDNDVSEKAREGRTRRGPRGRVGRVARARFRGKLEAGRLYGRSLYLHEGEQRHGRARPGT